MIIMGINNKMDVVVSYYNNESYKKFLKMFNNEENIIVYNKSGKNLDLPYTVKNIENIGREGETYLRYIIENYNNLKEYTLFIQDDVDNHIINYPEFYQDVKNYKGKFKICDTRWRPGWGVVKRVIKKGYLDMFTFPSNNAIKLLCDRLDIKLPDEYITNTCAFIVIHKDTIRKRPLEFYIKLKEWLLENDKNGFPLEHTWEIIFGDY